MLNRNVHFISLSIKLYELLLGHFRRIDWIKCLQCLHCRVLLRHGGIVWSDWKLCCWDIFSSISDYLLIVPRQHLQCIGIFVELFELWLWNFFKYRCNNLHNELDHLSRRNILIKRIFNLHKLPCRILCNERWFHKL